jgi:hypothetical protein
MVGMDQADDVVPAWQRWLLAERPRLSHFLVGAVALLFPAGTAIAGPHVILPAMGIATVVGGGLGVGWLLACGPRWLLRAPVMSLGVLIMTLGCLGHLAIMPRWEVFMRANSAIAEARNWLLSTPSERTSLPPMYDSGEGPERFVLINDANDETPVSGLMTPRALTRWGMFGRVESCFIVVHQDGTAHLLHTAVERKAVLARPSNAP